MEGTEEEEVKEKKEKVKRVGESGLATLDPRGQAGKEGEELPEGERGVVWRCLGEEKRIGRWEPRRRKVKRLKLRGNQGLNSSHMHPPAPGPWQAGEK